MFFVQPVRPRYIFLVPAVVAALIAADQQNRRAARIEGIQHAVRFALMLNPKLAHLTESRAAHIGAVGKWELRSLGFKQPDGGVDRNLGVLAEPFPPRAKFIGVLHFPRHKYNSCII